MLADYGIDGIDGFSLEAACVVAKLALVDKFSLPTHYFTVDDKSVIVSGKIMAIAVGYG